MGLNSLALNLKVGKQALKAALANVPHSGTVNGGHPAWTVNEAKAALHAHGSKSVSGPLKDQKLQEQIRQLKLLNDRKAGTLCERASVVASFGRIASRLAEARAQSESQAPVRMVGKDIAELREEVRRIWDDVGKVLAACASEFGGKPT
jgi:phage-related tail fiber protein